MQLMHVYSTGTQLFTDSSTGKPVRCRCTFALWHDAQKLQHNAQDACDPAHTDTHMSEAPAAAPASTDSAVLKRHTMQAVVHAEGTPAKALFDSGAGGGNYISKRCYSLNGIKLSTAAMPISVVGVLQSAADASSCCKLTVHMSSLSDTLVFYAIDMPGTLDMIIGDSWLHDRQAIMDFPKSCCHVYKNGRRYTILMSASSKANTLPAATRNDDTDASDSSTADTPHVIGYARGQSLTA
jgi:hypothetical protein